MLVLAQYCVIQNGCIPRAYRKRICVKIVVLVATETKFSLLCIFKLCVCNLFVPSGLTICCSSSRFNFGLMFFHPWERPVITTKRCMKSAHAHTITTHTRTRTTPGWCIIIVLFPACFALFIARFRPHPPRQHYGNYMIDRPIVKCAWSFWVYCLSSRWPSLWHHRRLTVSLQSVLSACDHNSVWMALHPAAKCPPHTEIDTQLREEERVIKRTLVHILP